jgi:hypothetical protein
MSKLFVMLILLQTHPAFADGWTVDWSRRFQEAPHTEATQSPPPPEESEKSIFTQVFSTAPSDEIAQEIVILQTETGFVPTRVQVRQNQNYKIDVVNVNEKEKNVSFILDAFSEHHATYFGKMKSFVIRPERDGVYTFESPETAFHGQLVVLPTEVPATGKAIQLKTLPTPAAEPESIATPEIRAPAAAE